MSKQKTEKMFAMMDKLKLYFYQCFHPKKKKNYSSLIATT